jgi:iron complex transport system substrate-binding protein
MIRKQRVKGTLGIIFVLMGLMLSPPAHAGMVVDETGRRVCIPAHPRRIVSLAPDVTEILFALGLDKEIVGVSQFSDYPDAAKTKPKVGSYVNLSLERILGVSPDLAIGTTNGNQKEAVNKLEKAGVPVYVVNPKSFSDIYRTLVNIGRITGREAAARQLADSMRRRAERIKFLTAHCRRPKVFVQIDSHPLVSVGRDTIYSELIDLAGGENIAARTFGKYPRTSMESLISQQPEVILLSSMSGKASRKAELDYWRRWQDIPAVRHSRIYFVNPDLADRFSPRIVQGLEELAEILHPERINSQKK